MAYRRRGYRSRRRFGSRRSFKRGKRIRRYVASRGGIRM